MYLNNSFKYEKYLLSSALVPCPTSPFKDQFKVYLLQILKSSLLDSSRNGWMLVSLGIRNVMLQKAWPTSLCFDVVFF